MKQERKTLPIGLIAGCAIILSATTVNGQQYDTTKVAILNEVIVTATRSEKNLNDIGRSLFPGMKQSGVGSFRFGVDDVTRDT